MLKTNTRMNHEYHVPTASLDYASRASILQQSRRAIGRDLDESAAPRRLWDRAGNFAPKQARSPYTETGLPDCITARRNVLTALWAGRLLGLSDGELTAYANDMRFVSHGDEKIVEMIGDDLMRAGMSLTLDDIQQALSRCHRVALHQTCATD